MHTLREQSLGAVVYSNVSIPRWMPNEIRVDLDSTGKYYAENIRLKAYIATLQDILQDGYEEFEQYTWNDEDKIKSLNEQLKWYIEDLHALCQEREYIVSQMFELSPLETSDYDYMISNSMLDFDDFTRDGLDGQYVQYKRIAKIKVSGNSNEDAIAAIAAVCNFCAIKEPYKVKLKRKKIVLY